LTAPRRRGFVTKEAPMARRTVVTWLALAGLLITPVASFAQGPLVVNVWGGNWKDTVERIVAKPFTAKTGIPVEFEVGGTLDRRENGSVSGDAAPAGVTVQGTHDEHDGDAARRVARLAGPDHDDAREQAAGPHHRR